MRTLAQVTIMAALALAGSGCATSPLQKSSSALLGAWYGEATVVESHERGDNINIRTADGRYVAYFRICEANQQQSLSIETGRWNLKGKVETTVTETLNGVQVDASDPYFHETYRFESLSGPILTYTSVKESEVFHAMRVDDHTRIPDNVCHK